MKSLPKVFNWNVKFWAVAVVLILILAGVGIVASSNVDKGSKTTDIVLSRVNTEGSGIFGDDPDMVTIENGIAVFHKDKWDTKVIATPGNSSIQHVMITEVIKKMGLNPAMFDASQPRLPGNVYLMASGVGKMKDDFEKGTTNGGIAWEPIYSNVIDHSQRRAYALCETGQIEGYDNHACCMVAGNSNFINGNPDLVIRFLAGYIKSVDFINEAKAAGHDSEKYKELLGIADLLVAHQYPEDVLMESLDTVNYTYDLTNFPEEYNKLMKSFMESGIVPKDADKKLGKTTEEFAREHVDGKYLEQAKNLEKKEYKTATIRVASLGADIHQIAPLVGIEKGFFEEYGIKIEMLTPATAGGDVIKSLLSGDADIGLAGAPPIVMVTVNFAC